MTGPTGVTAGEKRPAPGPLLLVQSFVNTLDREAGRDLLADGAAVQWLRDAGLLASGVSGRPSARCSCTTTAGPRHPATTSEP
jgi:hypothetical protein